MKLFIGCSASNDIDYSIINDSKSLIESIAKIPGVDLVYGAYNKGLMNVCYEAFRDNHKQIIGVTPKVYENEIDKDLLDQLYVTNTTMERFNKIYEESDMFLFLAGGIGTYAEFFNAVEEHRTQQDNKKIILYNNQCFYTPIIQELYVLKEQRFIRQDLYDCFSVEHDGENVKKMIKEMVK